MRFVVLKLGFEWCVLEAVPLEDVRGRGGSSEDIAF